jgi:hypothetical protein
LAVDLALVVISGGWSLFGHVGEYGYVVRFLLLVLF